MNPKPPALDALLSGVSPDDLEEFRETLRDRKIRPETVARILCDLKEYEQADRDFRPIEKAGRAFSEKRQRLRKRLARILAETTTMYEKELVYAKQPGVLDAQPGYRAARALLEALENIHDPILGPSMGFSPKKGRGPKKRPSKPLTEARLKYIGLDDHAGFLIRGLFPTEKKK